MTLSEYKARIEKVSFILPEPGWAADFVANFMWNREPTERDFNTFRYERARWGRIVVNGKFSATVYRGRLHGQPSF